MGREIPRQTQERFQINIRAFVSKVTSYRVFQQTKSWGEVERGKAKNISSAICTGRRGVLLDEINSA